MPLGAPGVKNLRPCRPGIYRHAARPTRRVASFIADRVTLGHAEELYAGAPFDPLAARRYRHAPDTCTAWLEFGMGVYL